MELPDAYISVSEALSHAGIYHNVAVEVVMISSVKLENGVDPKFS